MLQKKVQNMREKGRKHFFYAYFFIATYMLFDNCLTCSPVEMYNELS
jgi:hypothetical protein